MLYILNCDECEFREVSDLIHALLIHPALFHQTCGLNTILVLQNIYAKLNSKGLELSPQGPTPLNLAVSGICGPVSYS